MCISFLVRMYFAFFLFFCRFRSIKLLVLVTQPLSVWFHYVKYILMVLALWLGSLLCENLILPRNCYCWIKIQPRTITEPQPCFFFNPNISRVIDIIFFWWYFQIEMTFPNKLCWWFFFSFFFRMYLYLPSKRSIFSPRHFDILALWSFLTQLHGTIDGWSVRKISYMFFLLLLLFLWEPPGEQVY